MSQFVSAGIADLIGEIGEKPKKGPLQGADLEKMSEVEAFDAVTKDSVWPPPDWKTMVQGGVEARAAALIKIIRDRIPPKPPYGIRQLGTHYSATGFRPNAKVRGDYVRMLAALRDALSNAQTVDDVRSARLRSLEAVGWKPRADHEIRHIVMSVWRDRLDTLQVDYRDLAKAEAMVMAGWPDLGPPAWRKGYVVRSDGNGGHLLAKGIRIIADGFKTEAEAWESIRQDAQMKMPIKAPMPERPAVSNLAREGLPSRRDGDVMAGDFLAAFGFKAVEFGKWVPQTERQALLNMVHDAFFDLAAALDVPGRAIGLCGTIALSIGARSGGSTGADFDSESGVIALPRSAGSGELARCWAKAFDMWAGSVGMEEPPFMPRGATGRLGSNGTGPATDTSHLRADEATAWSALNAAIWRADPRAAAELEATATEIVIHERSVADARQQRDAFISRQSGPDIGQEGLDYLSNIWRWLASREENILPALRRKLASLSSRDTRAGESAFVAEAKFLCGRDGDFWLRPGEMFARGFECMVNDKLASMGGRNEILVCGVEEGRFASGYRGDPYPSGPERRRIAAALAAVVSGMSCRLTPRVTINEEPSSIIGPS